MPVVNAIASVVNWIVVWGPYWGAFALAAYIFSMLAMLKNSER